MLYSQFFSCFYDHLSFWSAFEYYRDLMLSVFFVWMRLLFLIFLCIWFTVTVSFLYVIYFLSSIVAFGSVCVLFSVSKFSTFHVYAQNLISFFLWMSFEHRNLWLRRFGRLIGYRYLDWLILSLLWVCDAIFCVDAIAALMFFKSKNWVALVLCLFYDPRNGFIGALFFYNPRSGLYWSSVFLVRCFRTFFHDFDFSKRDKQV